MSCFKACYDNLSFLSAHVAAKMRDDLLTGTEHSYKVTPQCVTPQQQFIMENAKAQEISDDEKRAIVLADPKFGMFSLYKYHITRGYKNEVLKKKNAVYCSHIFSNIAFLPIIIFLSQWAIYIALISDQVTKYEYDNLCPQQANWMEKLVMFGAAAVSYTHLTLPTILRV